MAVASGMVRRASALDATHCLAIYRPYVENTSISWELTVPTVDEMSRRIVAACATHEWLVLESADRIVGFAYGHAMNSFPSYQWSTEVGIYLHAEHQRRGGGRRLYTQLLERLAQRGYRRAFAGITQPNDASNGFHRACGFGEAGLYRGVEWKHGRWHDVAWMQRDLGSGDPDRAPGASS